MKKHFPSAVITKLNRSLAAGAIAVAATGFVANASAEDAQIIELTQVHCQFVESENDIDHGFESAA